MKNNSDNFLPEGYQTEEEKIELKNAELQEHLDYLAEKKIKALENIN